MSQIQKQELGASVRVGSLSALRDGNHVGSNCVLMKEGILGMGIHVGSLSRCVVRVMGLSVHNRGGHVFTSRRRG